MTIQEQTIAIAESMGWTEDKSDNRGLPPHANAGDYQELPNYTSDLNAMHEVIRSLSKTDRKEYNKELARVTHGERAESPDIFYLIEATAAQRAESYIKVIGKWTGDES